MLGPLPLRGGNPWCSRGWWDTRPDGKLRRQAGAGGKGEVCREFTSSVNVQGEMGRHP